ncbi:MAG: TolC family protein [Phycisphaerae bacterium]|nr:TolC family protein [Phycisphaerae bacterium]
MEHLNKYRNRYIIQFYCLLIVPLFVIAGCHRWHAPPESVNHESLSSDSVEKQDFNTPNKPDVTEEIQEPDGPLTLRDALSLTFLHNPELKAFSYSIRAAEARHLQAGLRPNPELGIDVEDVGGSGDRSGFDAAETTIQISQLFDLSGKVEKLHKVASFDTKLTEYDYRMKRLDLSMEVAQSFVELLFLQEKQELSSHLIDVSQAVIDSTTKRVQAGKDSPLDLVKAKVSLIKANIYHDEITGQIESLRIRLASFWSSKNPLFTVAAGHLDRIESVPASSQLEELLQSNPEVLQWAFEIQKRDAQLQLAKAESVPGLTLGGGIKHFNMDDDTAFVFGLSIPLPVSSRNQGKRLEAIQRLKEAKLKEQALTINMWSQFYHLHNQLQSAFTKANRLKNDVLPASQKIFDSSKISYEEGKIGYLELLDTQRNYFASKDEYIDILAKYHVCKTELEHLIGQPLKRNEFSN